MPLNNNFYGVYKFVTVRTSPNGGQDNTGKYPYIIKTLNDNNSMPTNAKFYMQGTPLTRVLDIKQVTENITLNAPILVPEQGQTMSDALKLLNDLVAFQYTNNLPNNFLPLLSKIVINIGVDGSSVDFTLLSDGDPNNATNVYKINYGATAQSFIEETGLNYASRDASNYDFCVDFGGFAYFVEKCTITIDIKTSQKNFLGVYPYYPPFNSVPYDGLHGGIWNPTSNADIASYSGWQFPFLSVGGIEITASGTASISIDNETGNIINWKYNDIPTASTNELIQRGNVTLQPTGVLRYVQDNFNIYFTANSVLQTVIPAPFAINKAVITQTNNSFSEGDMKVTFEVHAYVGI
jgi:hypothetical protein